MHTERDRCARAAAAAGPVFADSTLPPVPLKTFRHRCAAGPQMVPVLYMWRDCTASSCDIAARRRRCIMLVAASVSLVAGAGYAMSAT